MSDFDSQLLGNNFVEPQVQYPQPQQSGGVVHFDEVSTGAGTALWKVNKEGQFQGGESYSSAPWKVNMAGDMSVNTISINGVDVSNTFGTGGAVITDLINARFNSAEKTILSDFTFGASGALQIGTYSAGVSGDVRISPNGVLARNSANTTTFALDGTTGNATFGGTLVAASGTFGAITGLTSITQTTGSAFWRVLPQDMVYYDGSTYPFFVCFTDASGLGDAGDFGVGNGKLFYDNSAGSLTMTGCDVIAKGADYTVKMDASSGKLKFQTSNGTLKGAIWNDAGHNLFLGSIDDIVFGDLNGNGTITFDSNGDMNMGEGKEIAWGGGRRLIGQSSYIGCDGNFQPTSDNAYTCGASAKRWSDLRTVLINGSAYIEHELLTEYQKKEEADNGKLAEYEEGDVLVWRKGKLIQCESEKDNTVQAVASIKGTPTVLGAEKINVVGAVEEGDFLVTSSIKGCAMACKNPNIGEVIAQSLENNNFVKKRTIKAMIRKL